MLIKKSLLAAIMLSLSLFSQAKIFEATGVGDTPDAAKKDAVANAIKFSVGEMIISKEELNNEQMTQKIISYSDGYVKKIDVLSNTRLPNGVYETQVKVDIESQLLTGTLKEMNIAVLENAIDNDSLLEAISHFDKKEQNQRTAQDYQALAKELLLSPIEEGKQIIDIEIVGKLKPLTPEDNSELFPFELEVSVGVNKNYINNFKKLLDKNKSNNSITINELNIDKKNGYDNEVLKKFYLSEEKLKVLNEVLKNREELLSNIRYNDRKKGLVIHIRNKDDSEKTLYSYTYGNIDHSGHTSYYQTDKDRLLDIKDILPQYATFFYSNKTKIKLKFNLTKNEIINLKDIEVGY